MKIYNENKTQELENVDLTKGCLKNEKIISKHYEAVSEITVEQQLAELNSKGAKVEQIKGKWYKVVKEYESGGKDVEEIVIIPAVEAYDDYEDIQIYIPYTEEELEKKEIEKLRALRRSECFTIINRGQLWYATLTQEELVELNEWYHNWLNVTDTKIVPEKPEFLNNPISSEIQEIL